MASTDGNVYRQGYRPQVETVVSQKAKIFSYTAGKAGFTKIGVIGSFAVSESRGHDEIKGVGCGDTIAEIVPQYTQAATIQVERTALYLNNLWQAFGYLAGSDGLVRSLKHHQWPFDIKVEEVISEVCRDRASTMPGVSRSSEGSQIAIVTYYEGCWFTQTGKTYNTNQNAVSENGSIVATDVTDGRRVFRVDMNTGNRLRSRIFQDIDGVNRVRNQIGEAADIFGILR